MRMFTIIGAIFILFGSMIWFAVSGSTMVRDLAIEKTGVVMLKDQKAKLQIATHSMAVSLGHAIEKTKDIEEQKNILRALVDDIRFEEDNSGYFFIYEGTTNVALPAKKSLVGKDLGGLKDSNGVFPIKEMKENANKGSGFVQYIWPKPGAGDVPKLSYSEMIPGTAFWIGTGVYIDNIDQYQTIMSGEINDTVKASTLRMVAVSGILFAFIIGLCMFIVFGVVKGMGLIIGNVKDIAQGEGDLTKRVDIDSKDELGELAGWLNLFLERLQEIIKKLAQGAGGVEDASNTLASIATQMSGGASETSLRANQVAAATEEMSVNMNSVASAMEESSTNASIVAAAAEQMNSTINEISGTAESARGVSQEANEKVHRASQSMKELNHAAKAIGKVTDTINDISDQINLLALNATIEAARAGDAGKGFAVVANEIKDLASQTANATSDIQAKINNVQTTTDSTSKIIFEIIDVIDNVKQMVISIATAVTEQSAATKEIAGNVEQLSMGIQEVNENVSQSNQVAGDITRDISEVNHSAEQMASGSTKIETSAGELKTMAEELKQIVDTFIV